MKACSRCGSSARLRYDRTAGEWVCVAACGRRSAFSPTKAKRTPLFNAWWIDPASGERWRATRADLAEVTRLYYEHSDIREGRAA